MRSVKTIHQAVNSPIGDLVTYRALPTNTIDQIDPFLFLNHHGPQQYKPNNHGLPFGPHPHRGMETVTFILEGDIMHKDSSGHESVIAAGGIQWMTAGSGLIHAEVSSQDFKKNGGPIEILQLWLNLPSKLKMTPPHYVGLQKTDIPTLGLDNGKVIINLISGNWESKKGAFDSLTGVELSTIYFKNEGRLSIKIPKDHNIFFYVIKGSLVVNEKSVRSLQLIEFDNDEEDITIAATTDSIVLFGHAKPLNEPVVAQGPFVMNTEEEIHQAYADYQNGKFGKWK
jgi:redox-sensitive bicupin YhaK (pirin superfamily)